MSGGGGGGTNTIQKADPWAGVVPYLLGDEGKNAFGLFPAASQWMQGQSPQFFPGQTVVGTNQVQNDAIQTLLRQFSNPDLGGYNKAIDYASNVLDRGYDQTASGGFLNANPYIDRAYEAQAGAVEKSFKNSTLPGLLSAYASSSRYGSGANTNAIGAASDSLGATLNNLSADTYYKNYVNERSLMEQARARQDVLQQSAASALPGLTTGRYNQVNQGWQNILALGGDLQRQEQAFRDADIARWDYGQNAPLSKLQAYSQLLQGFGGGQSSSSTTGGGPSGLARGLSGALGGGLTGWSIGSGIGALGGAAAGGAGGAATGAAAGSWGGPIGAGVGALAGLLMGFL